MTPEELREKVSKGMGWWHDSMGDCYPEKTDKVLELFTDLCGEVIEAGRVDGMFIEWNGLNLADITMMKDYVSKLTGKEIQ